MSAWVKPGVKCVCVDDVWPSTSWYGDETLPVRGEVYTVRETCIMGDDVLCLRLREISNPARDYNQGMIEAAFAASRFRPVITQADDLEHFEHHLNLVEEHA